VEKNSILRIRRIFTAHQPLIVLLLLSAAYFVLCYVTDPNRPAGAFGGFYDKGVQYPSGWFGFWDQSQYLRLAQTLAAFDFSQLHSVYTYGLGYPLMGVPGVWLGFDSDPFVLFNLAAFVFTAFAVYRVASKFAGAVGGFIAGMLLVFASPLIHYVVQPWNSTVCLVAVAAIMVVATSLKVSKVTIGMLGILLGLSFAARYVDIVWLLPLALIALWRGNVKKWLLGAVILGVGIAIIVLPVLYSHYKVFGAPLKTPYVTHLGVGGKDGSDQGLQAYKLDRVPESAAGMFVGPRVAGGVDSSRGWLVTMFWVVLAMPGAWMVWKKYAQYRGFFMAYIGFAILAYVFYLSFRASGPEALKYGTLHYFKLFWPGFAVLAAVYIAHLTGVCSKKNNN
jgi:hypothetical protein